MTVKALPIYKIDGVEYFRDERLGEYRKCSNPNVAMSIREGDRKLGVKPLEV